MIYLILSPAFIDKDDISKGYIPLLKIGYTKEESKKSRFDAYITENPTMKILYLIENGDMIDELNLHNHFKHLKTKYGREWFKYDPEILDFFETHKTKESLEELDVVISKSNSIKINKLKSDVGIISKVNQIIGQIFVLYYSDIIDISERKRLYNKTVNLLLLNYSDLDNYTIRHYPLVTLDKLTSVLDVNVNTHLDTIYSIKDITERYKFLCSLEESTALSCLPHLPESFVNYYTVLGPERMRALRYNATDMKREYEGIIGNQEINIRDYIIPAFTVGSVYSKAEVKKKLGEIYASAGYSKTPRAVDLGDYFVIKNCMITNKETGKRDNCYQILSIKS